MPISTKQPNDRLRDAIRESFGTQAEFANRMGVADTQISRWVRGDTPIRAHRREIARRLGVSAEELWPHV